MEEVYSFPSQVTVGVQLSGWPKKLWMEDNGMEKLIYTYSRILEM